MLEKEFEIILMLLLLINISPSKAITHCVCAKKGGKHEECLCPPINVGNRIILHQVLVSKDEFNAYKPKRNNFYSWWRKYRGPKF
jgi:hypothetical protein